MKLRIRRRTDLAIRALRHLEEIDRIVQAAELALELRSTASYLPQVLRPLVRAGWVDSEPGPTGGYRLAGPLGARSVLEVIELMEGPTDTQECVLNGGPCPGQDECALHDPWQSARQALEARLSATPVSIKRGKNHE